MCYEGSCNPACGKCRPRRIVVAKCPVCQEPCQITREEYLLLTGLPHEQNIIERKLLERGGAKQPHCAYCGADLLGTFREATPALPCTKCNIICGFPCGQRVNSYDPTTARRPSKVPVGTL